MLPDDDLRLIAQSDQLIAAMRRLVPVLASYYHDCKTRGLSDEAATALTRDYQRFIWEQGRRGNGG